MIGSSASTSAGQPPPPINNYPFLGEGNIALNPTLEIDCPAQPFLASHFQVARDQGFTQVVYDSGELINDLCTHVVRDPLDAETTYYWRARVRLLSTQWTPWSNPSFFHTLLDADRNVSVFQQGIFFYQGTADADIRGSYADPTLAIREWNQGAQDVLRAGRRPPGKPTDEIYRSLIRFDLSLLSDAGAVSNVYLELTGTEHGDAPQLFTDRFSLYEVKKSWGEGSGVEGEFPDVGEVSWTYTAFPMVWSSPGASFASDVSSNADRAQTPLCTHQITNDVGVKVRMSSRGLAELVKTWIQTPSSNHGLILMAEDESLQQVLNLASREDALDHYRPRLVIEGREAAARAPNRPPVAERDVVYIGDGSTVMVSPMDNDRDPDNGPVAFQPSSLISHGQPENGMLMVNGNVFTYTPDPGFIGRDTVRYTITDGEETATANVVFWVAPPQLGTINANVGLRADVLLVNGGPGTGDDRRVVLGPNDSLDIFMDWPPQRFGVLTNFAMYLWLADTHSSFETPFDLGLSTLPMPLNPSEMPQPFRRVNNLGYENNLGTEKWPGPPTSPAPTTVLSLPNGTGMSATFILQGLMPDRASISERVGITNAVLVEIQ